MQQQDIGTHRESGDLASIAHSAKRNNRAK
jgi:hypothetical protein